MRLLFLGAPGVGKGTQAEVLSKRYTVPHIAMGDIIREAMRKETSVGLEAKAYVEKGQLVPDEVIIKVIRERLKEEDARKGYILDGFPRTIRQGEALTEILDQADEKIDHVVNFYVDEETLIKRISGRRSCPSCGKAYHLVYRPPMHEGQCDCGTGLMQRKDDSPETVKSRLGVYKNETAPLIEYYKKRGDLQNIEASGTISEISKSVWSVIESV
ncbi:MAG: adenylate kinase [Nitrospira sp.]|nr:adenylate kinase [Candidatus Manganitrophaceae bacterium]HIL35507.1 adenylate kinase [Candidatus Manganitrophaceae bacterium]